MKYIVICKDGTAFFDAWYTFENCWNSDAIHCVICLFDSTITFDGKTWKEIDFNHL